MSPVNTKRAVSDRPNWSVLTLDSCSTIRAVPAEIEAVRLPWGLGMSDSLGIGSPYRGWTMPKSYFRGPAKTGEAMEIGASRHDAADRFEISVSSAAKWHPRWRELSSLSARRARGAGTGCE